MRDVQNEKVENISEKIKELKGQVKQQEILKIALKPSNLHKGKILINAKDINFAYEGTPLWRTPLTFSIQSGDRISIEGRNGIGKTTLVKIITNTLRPVSGEIFRADFSYLYIDQDYSIIDNSLSVLEQAQKFNEEHFPESELKTLLHRHQFTKETWDRKCSSISGGEKMKLVFCCVTISNNTPDVIILDEPTNNLDMRSQEILTATIRDFSGTVIVISHDSYFIKEIEIDKPVIL